MTAQTKQKEAIDAGALEEHVRQLASETCSAQPPFRL